MVSTLGDGWRLRQVRKNRSFARPDWHPLYDRKDGIIRSLESQMRQRGVLAALITSVILLLWFGNLFLIKLYPEAFGIVAACN